MSSDVITRLEQVSPAWLTDVLSRSGALTEGAVAGFAVENGKGNWSTNLRLHVTYTPGARGALPERLFLKMVDTGTGDGESFDDSELRYYTRDYLDVPAAPLVRCYDGAYSPDLRRYHLLLEDVSETHVVSCDKPLTLEYGLVLAEGLAILHARWWGADRLAAAGAVLHSPQHILRFVEIAEPGVEHLLGRYAAELAPGWPALIRGLFANHPQRLVARIQDLEGFTLIHGDAGEYNILRPKQGERPIYLLDRQPFDWSLTTWLGVFDLVYILSLDWEPNQRRESELPILRRYHQQLTQLGVTGYTWERVLEDYALCLPLAVYVAVEYCRGGVNEKQWGLFLESKLRRSLTACEDWQVGVE